MHYVDVDVFVYWATDHAQHGKRATEILRHIELNEKAVTSTHALILLDKVLRSSQDYDMASFLDHVGKIRNLRIHPLSEEHLRQADAARKRFEVPLETAIAYAVAKERGAASVYSNNPSFDRTDLRRDF